MPAANRDLFDETRLQGLPLRNRLVRSATWEGLADPEGRVTPRLVELYRKLAEGGCGLLISGFTNVHPRGNPLPGCLGLFRDAQVAGLRRLAAAVHRGGGKLCLQLGHGGGQASSRTCGGRPLAPSALAAAQYPERPRAMTAAEVAETVTAFAAAAERARRAGCDALQLHAAHGYLLGQFLSPLTNRRRDGYGGDLAGRGRLLLEVVAVVQAAVGGELPLVVKLNGSDHLPGGLTPAEAVAVARELDGAGIAAIEVSAGTPASGRLGPVRRSAASDRELAYNADLARAIRAQVACPVMLVGGIRSLQQMQQLLRSGTADYLSISRPLVREPDLPDKLRSGTVSGASCSSCNGCFRMALKGDFGCVLER